MYSLYLNSFSLLIGLTVGQRFFIHQNDVELTIPIMKSSYQALDGSPIHKVKFTDLNRNMNSSYEFTLTNSPIYLTMNKTNGEIHFNRELWNLNKKFENLRVVVKNVDSGTKAKTLMTLNFIEDIDKKSFCEQFSCFYDKVHYMTTEWNKRKGSEKQQFAGDLQPSLYRQICKNQENAYFIENDKDSETFNTSKDQLIKKSKLNYDVMKNPNVTIEVTCKMNISEIHSRQKLLINITVVDINDNPVFVERASQNVRIFRGDLDFDEQEIVNKSSFPIIFRDADSLEANSNVEIIMFDKNDLFTHFCSRVVWELVEENSSSFVCDILFKRSGHLNKTEYCFKLKAFDTSISKKPQAVSQICVHTTNPTKITEEIESQDKDLLTEEKQIYPEEVELSQSAAYMARVASPNSDPENEIQFSLTSDPSGIFNITKRGGIIFVERPDQLANASLASIVTIEVEWKEHRQQIHVTLKAEEHSCNETSEDFCAHHDNQVNCESSCGVGSRNRNCKWRSHQGSDLISKTFATCVPDLDFCSDQICDPLEKLGSSRGIQICPQDCSRKVYGNVNSKEIGISGSSKGNVCTCDSNEVCSCGPTIKIDEQPTDSANTTELLNSTETTEFPTSTENYMNWVNEFLLEKKCGVVCMTVLSTSVIVVIVVVLTCIFVLRLRKVVDLNLKHFELAEMPVIGCDSTFVKPLAKYTTINENIPKQQESFPDFHSPRWEIDMKNVTIGNTIGEGEFGKVVHATLRGFQRRNSTAVVIKTVKDISNESELTSLKKEFEQLQEVSCNPHPNVIRLIGSNSKGVAPFIFLEFCVFESLKDYLMASRLETGVIEKVTAADILSFSLQIANGMSHLAEMKLVHRDLAARNVMLSEGKICKISDFGLTRNVCDCCDVYAQSSNDKVPVKWLAPESLTVGLEYTTKSDVWSFGILGYELVMLGGSPYPALITKSHAEFFTLLMRGCRMTCPINCSPQLFAVFESCWNIEPLLRPSFDELAKKFKDLKRISSIQLWTSPKFSEQEKQNFDHVYYRNYIERVRRAQLVSRQLNQRRLSSCDRRRSESSVFSPQRSSKKLKSSSSLRQVYNTGYDSNFDLLKLMRQRVSEAASSTSSEFNGYLPMNGTPPTSNGSLDIADQTIDNQTISTTSTADIAISSP